MAGDLGSGKKSPGISRFLELSYLKQYLAPIYMTIEGKNAFD